MRWAWTALSTVAVLTVLLISLTPVGASAARPARAVPPLVLASQTPWVQDTAPWFTLTLGIGEPSIPLSQLRVNATFYGRIGNDSELQQSLSGTPQMSALQRVSGVAVTAGPTGRSASVCVTVLPDSGSTPPVGLGACPAGSPTVVLGCTPGTGRCGDVYPVSVALLRQGSNTPLARFTTFLTYEEPSAVKATGPLRVAWVVPVGAAPSNLVDSLSDHKQVPVTVTVDPRQLASLERTGKASHLVAALNSLTAPGGGADEIVGQPYVPINLAALEQAGLGGEITAQIDRGAQILRPLHPSQGAWVDTDSNFTASSGAALAQGLQAAHVRTLVVNDGVLASSSANQKYTPAHPFALNISRGDRFTVLAANSTLDSRFNAEGNDPVLAANQLLASMSFVHFEDAFLNDPRGIVLVPPAGWLPSSAFANRLLVGMGTNPALRPVTLDQLTSQVKAGGDSGDPTTRRLQSGSAGPSGFSRSVVARIALARAHLGSLAGPTGSISGRLGIITSLSDQLLTSEEERAPAAQRSALLSAYDRSFGRVLAQVTLATEHTLTFTARTAPIPITVLSSAPYPFKVVMTVQSDKFNFSGGTRRLVLDRPTTPVRVQASARTSGDRLPVEVSLHTPDGQLLITRTTLTVHSTSISIVGIALTVLALLVLLMWWARTWRRSRRHRPRAH